MGDTGGTGILSQRVDCSDATVPTDEDHDNDYDEDSLVARTVMQCAVRGLVLRLRYLLTLAKIGFVSDRTAEMMVWK